MAAGTIKVAGLTNRASRRAIVLACVGACLIAAGCGGAPRHYNPALLDGPAVRGTGEVSQECGANASHGSVGVGSLVVLRRQRAVERDRNWVAGMRPFLGRVTRVVSRAGRDPQGCPVVHVRIDGGRHYWRVRDLTVIGRGLGPGGGEAVPQRCGQTDDLADFGLIQPGARVVLNRHRTIDGETNWAEEMDALIGQEAEVVEIGSVDAEGCPVFHVDVDDGEWAWRVRDATLVQAALPQSCDPDGELDHGALGVGDSVRLGHHRPVRGERNWRASMEQYVDRIARVTSLGPADDQGCPVVHVDVDQGARPWRVRDLVLMERRGQGRGPGRSAEATSGEIPQQCTGSTDAVAYGPIRVGVSVVLGRHRPVNGDLNWSEEMEPFVGRRTAVSSLSGADAEGCPGVRVEADSGEWFWRVRDLQLAE